jgi:phosphatidate cytidylyltransferase
MLRERVAIALLLLPLIAGVIGEGGWLFGLGVTLVLALAVSEFALVFRHAGQRPALPLMVAGVVVISLDRLLWGFRYDAFALAVVILAAMAWHALDYERGAPLAGTDFALTVSGLIYVGWIGASFISLRETVDGLWWFMTAIPAIWAADSAAYLAGNRFGRHRLAPRLSPKKSIEGYLAGIVGAALAGWGLTLLWQVGAGADSSLQPWSGLLLGFFIGLLAPIGDLGISMFKRQLGIKDTGKLLPGHGGALDRIDSWLWASVIGYYFVWIVTGGL